MSQVDTVALWAGLIASIAGIVLSIVAMVLSIVSNNRATAVNDQTIKSLQKIESDVERVSDDTRTLIKAGWDKMFDNFHSQNRVGHDDFDDDFENDDVAVHEIDETENDGAATPTNPDNEDRIARLEAEIEGLRKALATRQKPSSNRSKISDRVDRLLDLLSNLTPAAQALFELLSRSGHLNTQQYSGLNASGLSSEITELLRMGLIEKLSGFENDVEATVYWLPGKYVKAAKVATKLAPPVPASVMERVSNLLLKVGYDVR